MREQRQKRPFNLLLDTKTSDKSLDLSKLMTDIHSLKKKKKGFVHKSASLLFLFFIPHAISFIIDVVGEANKIEDN